MSAELQTQRIPTIVYYVSCGCKFKNVQVASQVDTS